ncbi:MAG: molybdopterin-dependent oxidoreductase [Acidimicrobiia bacterium]|nr:molybdopterin-dependent oxidoreductase [Acidimicrobiia bacterium]
MPNGQIGRSLPRRESEAKVSGTTDYIHNLALPGMLHGKIVQSPFAHARITAIDTSAALSLSGVITVVTAEEVSTVTAADHYGPAFHDQPVLAIDKVRFIGEPVACVIAQSERAAEEAVALVDVEYEEVPPVFDEIEACQPDAPLVHERVEASALFTDLKKLANRQDTNIAFEFRLHRGDVEQALAKADHVFDHTFQTPPTAHAAMEPLVSIGEVSDDGIITVHSATQNASIVQIELARLFGVPENRIRVRTSHLGGGFGGKLYPRNEPLAAVCTMLTRRPVRIALSMEEQFVAITRHATTIQLKTGVRDDGTIVARHCDVTWNTGAYADIGPRVAQKTGFTSAGPYDIENVSMTSKCVYTNMPPAGAFRGFGVPQVAWAYECQADLIARGMKMDPLEFRERNLLRNDQVHATGTKMTGLATQEVFDALRSAIHWDEPLQSNNPNVAKGRGVAVGIKAVITPSTSVGVISVSGDGSCTVLCGTTDMGQGSDTAYAQIVGEVLGLDAEEITVIHPDTAITPYDMGTLGSRSLYHMGNALLEAAEDVKSQLLALGVKYLETSPETVFFDKGFVRTQDGQQMSTQDLMARHFGMQAGNIIGRGAFTPSYLPPDPDTGQSSDVTAFWMLGAVGAEVSIELETGALTIDRLVVIGDSGEPINPEIVRTQLTGGAIMQMGMTRTEEMIFDNGQLTNPGLAFYKIPGILDIPRELEGISVSMDIPDQTEGPFGAKGVGETGTFAVSPAIANAIHDAVGVRVSKLPISDEVIWTALQETSTQGTADGN